MTVPRSTFCQEPSPVRIYSFSSLNACLSAYLGHLSIPNKQDRRWDEAILAA